MITNLDAEGWRDVIGHIVVNGPLQVLQAVLYLCRTRRRRRVQHSHSGLTHFLLHVALDNAPHFFDGVQRGTVGRQTEYLGSTELVF